MLLMTFLMIFFFHYTTGGLQKLQNLLSRIFLSALQSVLFILILFLFLSVGALFISINDFSSGDEIKNAALNHSKRNNFYSNTCFSCNVPAQIKVRSSFEKSCDFSFLTL